MNNALLKRFLSVVMAVAMVMSLVVIPVAADEADGGNAPVACTEAEGCTAESHNTSCPAHPDNVAPTVETVCNGADGCTLAADVQGHIEGCEAAKPAEKTAVDETSMECTCEVRCNEQAAEDCAVCKDNVNDCTGKTAEDIDAERKAAAEAAAKEASDQKVAAVQALIDALPNEVKRTEMAQYKEQVDAITAILNTMTEEQTAQLTGLDKLYRINIIENAVAKIGDAAYETLAKAVEEAEDGQIITLQQDSTGSGIKTQKNITIDFGGHTYTVNSQTVGSAGTETLGFQLLAGSKATPYNVTLKNGTIKAGDNAVKLLVQNYCNLTLSDITLDGTGSNQMQCVLANNNGTTSLIGNTNINAGNASAYAVDIDGSQDYYGAVKVTINTTGTINGYVAAYGGDATTEIKSGTITGAVTDDETSKMTVTGGNFTTADVSTYLPVGFALTNGIVAKTTDIQVKTAEELAEALALTDDTRTIVLAGNITGKGVVINRDVTIDFGTNTYTITSGVGSTGTETNGFQILQGNNVTLKNGTLNVASDSAGDIGILVQNYSNLTVSGMTLDGTNLGLGEVKYTLSNNCGNVNISNTTIKATDDNVAFDVCKFSNYAAPMVTISDSNIIGKIEVTEGISDNLTVNSGTFTNDTVKPYVALGATVTIGEDTYTNVIDTAAELQKAVNAGGEVTLGGDIDLTSPIEITGDVTLDLNGKTLSMTTSETNTTCLIQNNGTLTVKDSAGNGKMTFTHNAASTSFAANTILNCGTLTVEGGTIENTSGGIAYAIDNNSTVRAVSATITGGNVLSTGNGYPDGIRLFANGNTNTVNISGGTITSVWMQNPSDGSNGRNTNDPTASLTISNGNVGRLELEPSSNFNVAVSGGSISSVKYSDCAENETRKPTGFISGGIFDNQPADDMLKENYTTVQNNNNKYVVAVDESKIVAKIGDTPYFSIEDAIKDGANGAIVLMQDISGPITISSKIILDLNGKDINAPSTGNTIEVLTGGDLTIRDNAQGDNCVYGGPGNVAPVAVKGGTFTLESGTLNGCMYGLRVEDGGTANVKDGHISVSNMDGYGVYVKKGTLNVSGGKIDGQYMGISGNGTQDDTTINITGGTIRSNHANGVGVYHPQAGKLNISGGTISGATGVYVKGGTVTVSGMAVIEGTGTAAGYNSTDDGAIATGDALVVDNTGNAAYGTPSVTVSGGTFTSANAAPIASYARDGQTAKSEFVSGGTFSGKTALSDDVVVASKRVPDNTSGTYTLEDAPSSTDANGNTTYYADLDEMLDKNVTSITLNANETLRENHGSVANGTVINANGKTIVGAKGGGKLTAAGQMVIENLGANKASMVLEAGDSVAFGTDGTMTIRGAYDDSVNYASVTVTHLKNNRMVTDTYLLSRDAYLTMNASGIIGEYPGAGGEITTLPYTLVPVGNVNTYVQASTATLKFESNMFYETFKEAYVDGTLMVSGKDYTVAKGSTIITLSNARLRALSVGKHTLTIKGLDSKTAECPFYVSANYYADTTNPKTGDSILLALSVMLFTGCALAVIPFTLKKKTH